MITGTRLFFGKIAAIKALSVCRVRATALVCKRWSKTTLGIPPLDLTADLKYLTMPSFVFWLAKSTKHLRKLVISGGTVRDRRLHLPTASISNTIAALAIQNPGLDALVIDFTNYRYAEEGDSSSAEEDVNNVSCLEGYRWHNWVSALPLLRGLKHLELNSDHYMQVFSEGEFVPPSIFNGMALQVTTSTLQNQKPEPGFQSCQCEGFDSTVIGKLGWIILKELTEEVVFNLV